MSIQSELDRISNNVAGTYSVLAEAGADMPAAQNTDNLARTAAGIKAVLYNKAQSLTEAEKDQARENIGGASTPESIAAVLPVSGWNESGGQFTQTVSVAGIKATDTPVVDIALTGDADADALIKEAWGNVARITTAENSIVAYCDNASPAVAIPIQLLVIR